MLIWDLLSWDLLIWDLLISKLSHSLQEDVVHVQGEELLPAFLIKLT